MDVSTRNSIWLLQKISHLGVKSYSRLQLRNLPYFLLDLDIFQPSFQQQNVFDNMQLLYILFGPSPIRSWVYHNHGKHFGCLKPRQDIVSLIQTITLTIQKKYNRLSNNWCHLNEMKVYLMWLRYSPNRNYVVFKNNLFFHFT